MNFYSEKGKNFKGNPLMEDDFLFGQIVIFRNKGYLVGNVRNGSVELLNTNNELMNIVNSKSLILIK
jgi:hypothetical protein